MKILENGLLTNKYTTVAYDENFKFNAPHDFLVSKSETGGHLLKVHFQEGPIKECGVNGVSNEDLIAMVICRLDHFQKSEYSSRENALAMTKLEESLMWLRKRTMDREVRGVEGTHKI